MRIVRHRLEAEAGESVEWRPTPNVGGVLQPTYLVMHYTAGRGYASSVDWLANPAAKASAHVIVGRDGEIAQLARFDQVTWHAGASRWRGLTGLNAHSIGIELDNAGPLVPEAGGATWRAWFGGRYASDVVIEAEHKHGSDYHYWHAFTDVQIAAAQKVAALIVDAYRLIDVVGHDDIAPGRKLDPGPAFPMGAFKSRVLGRESDDLPKGRTIARLNLRRGPGAAFEKSGKVLEPKTDLVIRAEQGSWLAVDVLGDDGAPRRSGWVHGDYVEPA
ncbi:N-acetylmuramoyl-L-alanine amidase [Terricaulis sp.]|uniref:N-acetylmuramoyl-L-alanine amidase n=1 Tax=Terricaulis sp. TaxID=2768686 RepID=UPI003784308E